MASTGKSGAPEMAGASKRAESRRRQLERRDAEAQVQREFEPRFPHLPSEDIDVRELNGVPLRQILVADKGGEAHK